MHSPKNISQFSFPTDIHFGSGARWLASSVLKKQNLMRPLVVTDAGLSNHPMVLSFVEQLSNARLEPLLFADFSGNPVESHVAHGKERFLEHSADCVVALGGGAALDVAKAITMMSRHEGSILDYAEGHTNQRSVTHTLPFFIAIPTTAGTGSEVGRSTVISDEKTHEKKVIFHPSLLAKTVLVDPELTIDMPPSITAATGMDALSHLLESYLAKGFHPICDAIALHGLQILKHNFLECYDIAKSNAAPCPTSLNHRGQMMIAAMMGAIAFQKGLGVTHSCAHALSTVCNTHHGLANGIMLPFAMAFNARHVPHKMEDIARCLGLREHTGEAVFGWIKDLQTSLEIPSSLSQIGVHKHHRDQLVTVALGDGCHENNPVPVSKNDFHEIFTAALT